jgi:CMP/dCMP kinase
MADFVPVITVDGPSGTGKGTISHYLARNLQWHLLDSGALYRALALAAQRHAISGDDSHGLAQLACSLDVIFLPMLDDSESVLLEGEEVSRLIRIETVASAASRIAVIPEVRSALLNRQHAYRIAPGLVADGRDMGTVVFPDADLKIFLTASTGVRAKRRHKQLKEKGFDVNLPQLSDDISERDLRDSQRTVSPLRPADNAVIIDTTDLSIEDVILQVSDLVRNKFPDCPVNTER